MRKFTHHLAHGSVSRFRKRNAQRTLAAEPLEARKLMAADAMDAIVTDPADAALQTQLTHVVDPAQRVQPEAIDQARQSGAPLLGMDTVGHPPRQQTVDRGHVSGLGQVLGDAPHLRHTFTDLVMMELTGVPTVSPESATSLPSLGAELDGRLDYASGPHVAPPVFVETHLDESADRLAPEFEQLRLELGDEGFSGWLRTNRAQFGNYAGVPEKVVDHWVQHDPLAAEQFHQLELQLDGWLQVHDGGQDPPVASLPSVVGDADGDGTVAFSDFLILSDNYGLEVDAALAAGDFDGSGVVDFADFLLLSDNFGQTVELCGSSAGDDDDPKDGTEIQSGGDLEIRAGSRVYISDETVDGDKEHLTEDAPKGTPIKDGMRSWQDVIDDIKDLPDGSITGDLVLSGHGADGGVDASGSDIDGENLTAEQAAVLKKKLGPKARIVVLGCSQADAEDNDHMQRLANLTGRPVVGNQGGVNGGTNGDGDWFRFDPK